MCGLAFYGHRSNPGPDVCSCERSFSQRVDSVVAEVFAKGLTLLSLEACPRKLHVAIDSVVLPLIYILVPSIAAMIESVVAREACSSVVCWNARVQTRAISLLPPPEAFLLTRCLAGRSLGA